MGKKSNFGRIIYFIYIKRGITMVAVTNSFNSHLQAVIAEQNAELEEKNDADKKAINVIEAAKKMAEVQMKETQKAYTAIDEQMDDYLDECGADFREQLTCRQKTEYDELGRSWSKQRSLNRRALWDYLADCSKQLSLNSNIRNNYLQIALNNSIFNAYLT